jgi:hypothetical protein
VRAIGIVEAEIVAQLLRGLDHAFVGMQVNMFVLHALPQAFDPIVVETFLDDIRASLDIDGNGTTDALTDGLLVLRYLRGVRGDALIAGAADPVGSRKTASEIENYLQSLMP